MTKKIILSKADYNLFSHFIKNQFIADNYTIKRLADELKTAIIIETEKLPEDVIKLNSHVRLKVKPENKVLSVKLVVPTHSDIKKKFISVISPLGAALIGYQKGDIINWEVPAGMKTFEILEVENL